jgi:hypothetical protein
MSEHNIAETATTQTPVEDTRVESKLHLKINEDPKNLDFTFSVPNNCSWEFAKRGLMATYEQIYRLELDDIKKRAAEQAAAEATPATEVTPEVVS